MKIATIIACVLVIVGALVWGLIGIFNFNVVASIFGAGTGAMVSRIIYSLVGLAGVWFIFYCITYQPFRRVD